MKLARTIKVHRRALWY